MSQHCSMCRRVRRCVRRRCAPWSSVVHLLQQHRVKSLSGRIYPRDAPQHWLGTGVQVWSAPLLAPSRQIEEVTFDRHPSRRRRCKIAPCDHATTNFTQLQPRPSHPASSRISNYYTRLTQDATRRQMSCCLPE